MAKHDKKQHLLAIYASISAAFLSIALTIEVSQSFLAVCFAAEIFAIAWINNKVDISALRYIISVLVGIFCCLISPQILLLIESFFWTKTYYLSGQIPILVKSPLIQLGLPCVFFAISSYLVRKEKEDKLVYFIELVAVTLGGVLIYCLLRNSFHLYYDIVLTKAGFLERTIITNSLFIYGLACMAISKKFTNNKLSVGGFVIVSIAILRIVCFDLLAYNPLWSLQPVGTFPIINWLLLVYGLPIILCLILARQLVFVNKSELNMYNYGFILLLIFILISLNVRQIFNGTYLNGTDVSNMEVYTYSVVWLLFGIGLLFFGTLYKDQVTRLVSLGVILFTIGKVFIYDSSALEGLLRVFSFFGLGLSLLAISWFYARFVSEKQEQE